MVASLAAFADLTGSWQLHLDPDFGGEDDTIVCTFAQDGRTLTIRCGSGFPLVGAVDGDKVRFEAKRDRRTSSPRFTAVLDDQARTMKGSWHLDGGELRDGKFDARRQQ